MTTGRKNLQSQIIDHAFTEYSINPNNYPYKHQTTNFRGDILKNWIKISTKPFNQCKDFIVSSYTESKMYHQYSKYFQPSSKKKAAKKALAARKEAQKQIELFKQYLDTEIIGCLYSNPNNNQHIKTNKFATIPELYAFLQISSDHMRQKMNDNKFQHNSNVKKSTCNTTINRKRKHDSIINNVCIFAVICFCNFAHVSEL